MSGDVTELLLVRHGQTALNAARRWQGHADEPLSDLGRQQAREVAHRLRALRPTALVSSDLPRAVQTAEVIGAELGLALRLHPDWREWDVGEWSGLERELVRERWPELRRAIRRGDHDAAPPGGESRAALAARARAAAEALAREHPGGRVVVVTHRGVIKTLEPDAPKGHGEITRLEVRAVDPSG